MKKNTNEPEGRWFNLLLAIGLIVGWIYLIFKMADAVLL